MDGYCAVSITVRVALGSVALLTVLSSCEPHESRRSPEQVAATATGSAATRGPSQHERAPTETLRDGDIIFQKSTSRQSEMVRALTGSEWTHMGVIFTDESGPTVLEAVSPVRYTKLADWIARGRGGSYAVKRLRDSSALSPEGIGAMRSLAAGWLGRPYDLQFRWGDDALYCSELVHKLFDRALHVGVGRLQRADDMNLDDPRVKSALSARFAPGKFDPAEPVVTPGSIFEDDRLETIP